jgi:hypothetical protein
LQVGAEAAAGGRRLVAGVGGRTLARQVGRGGDFVERRFVEGVADELAVDSLAPQLLLQQAPAAGMLLDPPFDPGAGEAGVVEVAPSMQPGDDRLDRLRRVAALAQPVAHFPFGAGPVAEEGERRRGRAGDLVGGEQGRDPRGVEFLADAQAFRQRRLAVDAEGEFAVDGDVQPLAVARLRRQVGDAARVRRRPRRRFRRSPAEAAPSSPAGIPLAHRRLLTLAPAPRPSGGPPHGARQS